MSEHDKVARTWLVNEFGPDADTTLVGMVESLCGLLASVEEEARKRWDAAANPSTKEFAEMMEDNNALGREAESLRARVAELERIIEDQEANMVDAASFMEAESSLASARALNARLREALGRSKCPDDCGDNQGSCNCGREALLSESASDASDWTREVERRALASYAAFDEHFGYEPDINNTDGAGGDIDGWYCRDHQCAQPDDKPHLDNCRIAPMLAGARAGEGGARE